MQNLTFVPFEYPQSEDGQYIALLTDDAILRTRREQLGLSQQQVADMANIKVSQYQRFEAGEAYISGTSMRIGLAVCAVLMLDPYSFLPVHVSQPESSAMKPLPLFRTDLPDDFLAPKRVGRKTTWKEIMTVFINYEDYSLLIPYDVLNKLGEPEYVQMSWNMESRRIVLRSASADEESVIDVPKQQYEKALFSLPTLIGENPIDAMNWHDTPYAVESRLVRDRDNVVYLMIDLNTAKKADTNKIEGVFMTPECFSDCD